MSMAELCGVNLLIRMSISIIARMGVEKNYILGIMLQKAIVPFATAH